VQVGQDIRSGKPTKKESNCFMLKQ
jgi:hypothetical protein